MRKPPGTYLDGGGLYLQVSQNLSRSWIFRFKSLVRGKERYMGLGPIHTISLAQARELANQARGLVASGIDPIDERKVSRQTEKQKASMTFENAVEGFIGIVTLTSWCRCIQCDNILDAKNILSSTPISTPHYSTRRMALR
jgi:hypothetical protein